MTEITYTEQLKPFGEGVAEFLNLSVELCHGIAEESGWWNNVDGSPIEVDENIISKKILLIHCEISEAVEGLRKDLMDDHLPTRKMVEVEFADALIRLFDLAGAMKLDLGGAVVEKLIYNSKRADHKLENRAKDGGKKF